MRFLIFCFSILALSGLNSSKAEEAKSGPDLPQTLNRIHFGSCIKQAQPVPIFETILRENPGIFLMIGDNVYADTHDIDEMRTRYAELDQKPLFQKLRKECPILATWDDHDYGMNDSGAEYPERVDSQQVFLDFFGVPEDSPRRKQEGVYHSAMIGPVGERVQILLLDTRYFRGPLKAGERRTGGKYYPETDPSIPMLGEKQWQWLEGELAKKADLRVIVSSIQFIASAAGQETWANLPAERTRMLKLIESTKAANAIFISGDRHWSDISMQEDDDAPYPIFDLTSSGLNQIHPRGTPTENEFRVTEKTYHKPNYGVLAIDWEKRAVDLEIRDLDGEVVMMREVPLAQLDPWGGSEE